MSFRFWICCLVSGIFAIKVWSGPKLTEILHVLAPKFFLGEHTPNFWSQFIKYSQIPIMWQSFRAIVRGISEKAWRIKQESCAIAKMTAQCALHMGALKIFGTAWLRQRPLFLTFSWAFVPIDSMNVTTKFVVRSFTSSWDNRGYPKNLGSPWIRLRSFFSKKNF